MHSRREEGGGAVTGSVRRGASARIHRTLGRQRPGNPTRGRDAIARALTREDDAMELLHVVGAERNGRRYGGAVMARPMFGKVEALGPWTAHIQAMEQALLNNDPGESVRAWRQAYSSALSHPGWLGLLTV